jgi:hypothetical protein
MERPGLLLLFSLLATLLAACAAPYDERPASGDTGVRTYQSGDPVAVLLPQRGYFAGAARAVKDGLVAAQGASTGPDRLALRFYDSSDAQNALALLEQAAADGATLAIGPLQREAVSRLGTAPRLPMTTLALNNPRDGMVPPAGLYRFALSPEDEAEEAARGARSKGYSSALIIYPDGVWGTRMTKAFIDHWQAEGGVIEAGLRYDADSYAFETPLERLFQTAGYGGGGQGLGTAADCIFFIGTAQANRALWPEIRAVAGNRLPMFTTSHVYSMGLDALRANGLVGIYFVDIPWMVASRRSARPMGGLRSQADSANIDYQRFFALGLDAYRLAPIVAASPLPGRTVLEGQTGTLSVTSDRRIRRRLELVRVGNSGLLAQY